MTAAPAGYGYDVDRPDPRAPEGLVSRRSASPRRRRRWVPWVAWGIPIAVLVLVSVVVWFLTIRPIGIGTSLVAFTAALVPVAIVFLAVWWIDRYTPQPRITLVYAFAWGAAGSVALTFLVGGAFAKAIAPEDAPDPLLQVLNTVVQAPVIEESMKSAGLLLLLLWGRRFLSNPIDGVIYAALIAGGFAFTENILYFGRAFQQAQAAGTADAFWQTFLLRGLLSPFAHVSFTSLCGLGLGIAAGRRSLLLYGGLGLGGLALGMCLHAVWNGSTFLISVDPESPMSGFITYYLTVQVPIFLVLTAIVLWLRHREKKIVRRRLSEYGRAGWFSRDEVTLLVSMRSRRRAEKWASRYGAVARTGMRDLIRTAVELAMERNAALHGPVTRRSRDRERELLERITADRRLLGALTRPVVR